MKGVKPGKILSFFMAHDQIIIALNAEPGLHNSESLKGKINHHQYAASHKSQFHFIVEISLWSGIRYDK